jgi:membrane-associated protease RseP (regulator of RpoE activity)
MINEPSALSGDQSVIVRPSQQDTRGNDLVRQMVEAVTAVMEVYRTDLAGSPQTTASFTGRLRVDSETAYAQVDRVFARLDHQTILTTNEQGQHVFIALRGRVQPKPRSAWLNAVLLVLTVLSLFYVGAMQEAAMREWDSLALSSLWKGWPYALSVLAILGVHELGHYFAARYHGVAVTLPYFIPLPFGFFGTLGAFIQIREPVRNRRILFDIGVAGPLAGFVLAVPILLIGLATSHIEPLPNETYILEGNSLLYALAKFVVFGQFLPNGQEDVFINQVAKAGWTGLFITGLNLIPIGQLDGGHVISTLLGRKAQRLYLPIVGVFLALSFFNSMWLLWTLLLFFLGRLYAMPLDTVTPLDTRRRWLAYAALIIFVLVFVPNPLQIVEP